MAIPQIMKHSTGVSKAAYVGFSWTVFLFGFWPPLFRGDFKWFGIGVLVALVNYLLLGVGIGIITTLVWWFFFAAKYNEWHMNDLRLAGFV